jgi:hypothetical protein
MEKSSSTHLVRVSTYNKKSDPGVFESLQVSFRYMMCHCSRYLGYQFRSFVELTVKDILAELWDTLALCHGALASMFITYQSQHPVFVCLGLFVTSPFAEPILYLLKDHSES